MKVLVVVAHPDDEVLGMGGTLLKHKSVGDELYIHILTDGHSSRYNNENTDREFFTHKKERIDAAHKVSENLNVKELLLDNFNDQMLDYYPLLRLTKAIENFASRVNPDIVYTHSYQDVNEDHKTTFSAVISAFRPTSDNFPAKIFSAEVPSSTEWGFPGFSPNVFVDISEHLDNKIELISIYKNEIKPYPHPRSIEKLKISAKRWGSVIYTDAAEPFLLIRSVWL